jgi:hypothetical protein
MIKRTFTIAEASFSELVGHFDTDLGTLRYAVINGEGEFLTIEFFDAYADAREHFITITQGATA